MEVAGYRQRFNMEGRILTEGAEKKSGNPIYYVHITFKIHEVEIRIAHLTVRKSDKPGKTWWVQMPSYMGKPIWHPFVEVEPTEFWQAIEDICVEVVQNYLMRQASPLPTNLEELSAPHEVVKDVDLL
jgi:hypothetical protein